MYFYQPDIRAGNHFLEDEECHHCVKVLRKKTGDTIGILDGKGGLFEVRLTTITSKKAEFTITSETQHPVRSSIRHIAIAPTKNSDRMEWFVEKACELGVNEITFVLTRNSERPKIRLDRFEKKAISALKQSKSGYITKINPMVEFDKLLKGAKEDLKFIAYVQAGLPHITSLIQPSKSMLTLIGPEGDFDPKEVEVAEKIGFQKVSLGDNVLRTETAGLAVTVWGTSSG